MFYLIKLKHAINFEYQSNENRALRFFLGHPVYPTLHCIRGQNVIQTMTYFRSKVMHGA